MTFKTSDADGLVKYFFGDIFYSLKDGKETGYYRKADLSNKQKAYQKSSFIRGNDDFGAVKKQFMDHKGIEFIERFRNSFQKNIDIIENLMKFQAGYIEYYENEKQKRPFDISLSQDSLLLFTAKRAYKEIRQRRNFKKIITEKVKLNNNDWDKIKTNSDDIIFLSNFSTSSLFLHFDFSGKQWYEFNDELGLINEKLMDDFVEEVTMKKGYILKKYLYKTLSSPEKDVQFPNFRANERYKNKIFQRKDEIADLIYAIDYTKTALVKVPYSDIKIIVLPKGKNLNAQDYERFYKKDIYLKDEPLQEEVINQSNKITSSTNIDILFESVTTTEIEALTQFDFIFSKQGSQTSPDTDLIEIAGLEKSFINYISLRIGKISSELFIKRREEVKSEKLEPFSIYYSF